MPPAGHLLAPLVDIMDDYCDGLRQLQRDIRQNSPRNPGFPKYAWIPLLKDSRSLAERKPCSTSPTGARPIKHLLVCGCGPLSLAVIEGDLKTVSRILAKQPSATEEINCFGQTCLHIAAYRHDTMILETLLQSVKISPECYLDRNSDNALVYALHGCKLQHHPEEHICDVIELLLAHGCEFLNSAHPPVLYASGEFGTNPLRPFLTTPPESLKHIIRSLKAQRMHVKVLAKQNLEGKITRAMGLDDDTLVLDGHAQNIVRLLRSKHVPVPIALSLGVGADWAPIYSELDNPKIADQFYKEGFRDVNVYGSHGLTPLMTTRSLPFALWLLDHGADAAATTTAGITKVSCTAAHLLIHNNSEELDAFLIRALFTPVDTPVEYHVFRSMLRPGLRDRCRCVCSPRGCHPFHWFLRQRAQMMTRYLRERENVEHLWNSTLRFLDTLKSQLENRQGLASAAIRALTFEALELPHTCCGRHGYVLLGNSGRKSQIDLEEARETQSEQRELVDLPEDLVPIFRRGYRASRMGLSQFLQKRWKPVMEKIVATLKQRKLSEKQRREAEEVGIIWMSDEDDSEVEDEESNLSLDERFLLWAKRLDEIAPLP